MSFSVDIKGDSREIIPLLLAGSLDSDTAPQLQATINDAIYPETQALIIDMKHLEFISSAGLRIIFKTRKLMDGSGGKLVLINPQPQVRKVFDIIKAAETLSIFQNDAELDEYLADIQRNMVKDE